MFDDTKQVVKSILMFYRGNIFDGLVTFVKRYMEIKKFNNKKRKSIWSRVKLSGEQKKEIDKLYKENYGRKIPYTWHRYYTAFTGEFHADYFPELIYIPEFERYMNLWTEYVKVFADKNVLPMIASANGVIMPKTIVSNTKGFLRDGDNVAIELNEAIKLLKKRKKLFLKPTVDSSSGKGCSVLLLEQGIDSVSGKNVEEILNNSGQDYVIQECINCSHSIKTLYPNSVNTFRVITYRWKNEICHMPALLRIGRGGNTVDNAHAGGIFIAIDDDGTLHKKAVTEFKEEFYKHPDTGITFEGYKINCFDRVLKAAERMHQSMPQIGTVNWDFTLNSEDAPVLIEANLNGGSVWLSEMSHGKPAFGEKTEEVLRWMQMIRKTKPSNRRYYAFGNTEGML